MDQILTDAYYNFGSFWDKHLFGTPGTSPFNLFHDRSLWDWSQLISPSTFVWKTGVTPFSDLETIRWSWVFYFFAILSLRRFMLDRSPKDIKTITAVHNLILLVGSILMFLGGVVGIYYAYMQGGWSNVFVMDKKSQKGIMFYSLYVFYLSKFYELLDTIILVLKKELIFLHVYHHTIVILMVWGWLAGNHSFAVTGLCFNSFVHIFMYYYYFASNLGYNVWFKKYITTLQIVQFIGSFLVMIPFFYYASVKGCDNYYVIYASLVINLSFLGLFVQFYIKNYNHNAAKKTDRGLISGGRPSTKTTEAKSPKTPKSPKKTRASPKKAVKEVAPVESPEVEPEVKATGSPKRARGAKKATAATVTPSRRSTRLSQAEQ